MERQVFDCRGALRRKSTLIALYVQQAISTLIEVKSVGRSVGIIVIIGSRC